MGNAAYRLDLPPVYNVHPVFHVSSLKPYHADEEDDSRNIPQRPPAPLLTIYSNDVDYIITHRNSTRGRVKEYLVKWKGLPDSEASWEDAAKLQQFPQQVAEYHQRLELDEGVEDFGGGGIVTARQRVHQSHQPPR